MRVANVMLGRGRGGLEESFVVYHLALRAGGHEVVSLLDGRAAVRPDVEALGVPVLATRIWSHWDPWTVWQVRRRLRQARPDVVVCHGNRAGRLVLRAARGRWPVVARLPNYRFRRILGCDGFIAILPDQRDALIRAGVEAARVFHIPSMLPELPAARRTGPTAPPVIVAMGRWVSIKGFDLFLRALAWLKARGHLFRGVLAGDGPERPRLLQLLNTLQLQEQVELPGWITDRTAFWRRATLACVPSWTEAFSRVLLEAMAHEVAVVVTDSEGPRQIVEHERTGLVVPRGDWQAMGQALERLLLEGCFRSSLAAAARRKVEQCYTLEATAPQLSAALETVRARHLARGIPQ
ncbi:glycosyltransferase [Limisphaera sp. VF-2]|uniref:glycosyltransferase n=1 Tax=Limisphaera sp. VF-2 TaxID=3400418 RepID=UPI0030975EB3